MAHITLTDIGLSLAAFGEDPEVTTGRLDIGLPSGVTYSLHVTAFPVHDDGAFSRCLEMEEAFDQQWQKFGTFVLHGHEYVIFAEPYSK